MQQQQQGHWYARSSSGLGGSSAPDDWEIDISQLHIDSKVGRPVSVTSMAVCEMRVMVAAVGCLPVLLGGAASNSCRTS
jgi:hypothetical protein